MSHLYLTSAAADAEVTAGSGTKWKAGFTPGASATHLNKNSVAGPTAPLQATDGAAGTDGTAVAFYTPPLWGVTIAGAITCSLWTRENATANNVAPTIRIERCSGDGTVLSTIVSETTSHGAGEMPTTAGGASDTISVSAANVTDTTLSDGDRLRITLWIDDAAGQGGTGSMASGGRGEFWVNGPNGAQGQAQLAFTEIVCPQAGPHIKQIVESTRATTDPNTAALTGLAVGDELYIMAGGDQFGANNDITDVTVSATVGSIGSVTDLGEDLSGSNVDWIGAYLTTAGSSGSATIQLDLTRSGGTPGTWHFWVTVVAAGTSDGHTIVTKYTANTTQVVSLTVPEAAAVLSASYDWDSGSVGTPTPGGSNAVENSTDANLTENSHYWLGQPAGTRNYGTTGASGTVIRCHGIVIEGAAGGTAHTVNQTDDAGLTDTSAIEVVKSVTQTDSAGLTDTRVLDQSKLVTDSVGLTDSAALLRSPLVTDSVGLTDASTVELSKLVSQTDSAGLTDSAVVSQTKGLTDSAGLTDGTALTQSDVITDSSGLTDAAVVESGRAVAQTDSAGLTDSQAFSRAQVQTDSVGLTDSAGLAASKAVTDSAGLTDAAAAGILRDVAVSDSVGLTDATILSRTVVLTDLVGLADATALSQIRVLTDSAGLTDSAETGAGIPVFVPRPGDGTTPRPGLATTSRPPGGTTSRPPSAMTARPSSANTPRP